MSDIRLLVAEDDPVFRRVIEFTLRRSGYRVDAVADGFDAWNALNDASYDILITDHQMPRCSGLNLIARLREHDQFRDLPIVLCTAKGLELDSEHLSETLGISSVMHKPFSPRILADRVACLLEAAEAQTCGA